MLFAPSFGAISLPEVLLCAGAFGAAIGCAVAATRKTMTLGEARHWPSVPGRIIESQTIAASDYSGLAPRSPSSVQRFLRGSR